MSDVGPARAGETPREQEIRQQVVESLAAERVQLPRQVWWSIDDIRHLLGELARVRGASQQMQEALAHVSDEIMAQLSAGVLKSANLDSRVYWSQVADVAQSALRGTRPHE